MATQSNQTVQIFHQYLLDFIIDFTLTSPTAKHLNGYLAWKRLQRKALELPDAFTFKYIGT